MRVPTSSLRAELFAAREQTDLLFRMIAPAALYGRPVAERHRIVFYLGHLEAFDWNLLARRSLGESSFHETFDRLFERGIDPPPGEEPVDAASDWPTREEIADYNLRTRHWIDKHLEECDPWVLRMAIEHRLMHAETLAYVLHHLPYAEKSGPAPFFAPSEAPANPLEPVSAGSARLGQTSGEFGWDNEFAAHSKAVPEFAITRYKITNAEYLEFVKEGGEAPLFWRREGEQWFWNGMFGSVPLPLDWPVWTTWNQASAFARWRGLRLPSEAQWHRAAEARGPGNYGFRHWDPVRVQAFEFTGNGWEWTRDVFAPFEGFAAHGSYPGYSADFFDGSHYVMKGASPRTAPLLARTSFRNWFRPEYPYMYAGFHLVEERA